MNEMTLSLRTKRRALLLGTMGVICTIISGLYLERQEILVGSIRMQKLHGIELSLLLGADINLPDHLSMTPIMHASLTGNMVIFERLRNAGAHYQALDRNHINCLIKTASRGHLHLVKHLHKLGLDVNQRGLKGYSALHASTAKNHLGVSRYLIQNGATTHHRDQSGTSPLLIAAELGHNEMAILLLDQKEGLNLNAADVNGETPLSISIKRINYPLVLAFIEAGAMIRPEDFQDAQASEDPKLIELVAKHFTPKVKEAE